MIAKFSLYDFIAAVIPGMLFIWALSLLFTSYGISLNISLTGELAETSILIALSYVTGLLLQGISQGLTEKGLKCIWGGFPSARWLLENDTTFSSEYKARVFEIATSKFGIQKKSNLSEKERLQHNREVFYLCYNSIENLSDKPQTFNAHYGLFRCLLTSFIFLFIIAATLLIKTYPENRNMLIGLAIFSLLGSIISYFRTKKRGEDFVRSIYDLFVVNYGPNNTGGIE